MDQVPRDRLRDDLRGVLGGDLLLDDIDRSLYATDASRFDVMPLAVVRPRHEGDVRTVVRYAAENSLPVTARGAGTGTAGAALGPGLVLDFSCYLRDILEVTGDSCRVQAGVTWEQLSIRLARDGLRVALEPAASTVSTLGGLVATDAGGPRVAALGYPRDHVIACRAVLDNGDVADLSLLSRQLPPDADVRLRTIHRAIVTLLDRHHDTIAKERPRTPYYRGYRLDNVLTGDTLHYPRLLAGSEGTLALFTELTLRTVPLPTGRAAVLIGFADLADALAAAVRTLPRMPSACELLDGRLLSLLRPRLGGLLPSSAGAALLVEFETDSPTDAKRCMLDLIDDLGRNQVSTRLAVPAFANDEIARLWSVVGAALPSLSELRGGPPAVSGIEDIAVPPETLPEFLPKLQDVLQRHETTAAFLVHAAAGHVHARPFLSPADPAEAAKLWAIAEDVYALVLDTGGAISGRHGFGLARTPWVAMQHPQLLPVFRELKAIFDRRNVLSPGNVVGPDPARPAWPLRKSQVAGDVADQPRASFSSLLLWKPDEPLRQIGACSNCGDCRTTSPTRRMCPIFRAEHTEAASPRAKINLLRNVLETATDTKRIAADDVRAIADLCVNCKMCAHECPSNVNVPKLMLEAKAANAAEHGLDRADWVMSRLATFSRLGSVFWLVTNQMLRGPFTRWFLEKFFGIARARRLPRFARRSFLRIAKREGWTHSPPTAVGGSHGVALFIDTFANYHDPQIAEAAVRVLRHNGVPVVVPRGQRSCGMEALAHGDVETAREVARHNLKALAGLVRGGWRVVCPEPTAALALRHDYLDLTDNPDAQLVADATIELTAFLAELHTTGRLRTDFQPLELMLGHHLPCHLKALGGEPAGPALLRLIPGLRVYTIDVGCSGMAGTFGLRADSYATSLAAGRAMLDELNRPRVMFGSTECSACRLQIEDSTGKRTLHPVQYLALAYGLMPELERRFVE
ncbi:MAG: FAD-linked oxidase C-terminal domain-containing protein [Gemmataceae bacterium]